MGRLGGGEILVILLIALLIFGPSKLADMGKGLGQGLKNFKKGLSQTDDDAKPGDQKPVKETVVELEPPAVLPEAAGRPGEPPRPAATPEPAHQTGPKRT